MITFISRYIVMFSLCCFITSFQAVCSSVIDERNPHKLIESVGNKTFERVKSNLPALKKNKEHYKDIVRDELLPYVDYQYAALKALGKTLRTLRLEKDPQKKQLNDEQLKIFINNFKQYLITIYAGVFTQYTGQKVIYHPPSNVNSRKVAVVKATILETGKPNIQLAFKLRKQKDNTWAAYDMLVEGISLLDAKKSELEAIVESKGLGYVNDMLAEKAAMPVSFAHARSE